MDFTHVKKRANSAIIYNMVAVAGVTNSNNNVNVIGEYKN